jgi:hypothetical protein
MQKFNNTVRLGLIYTAVVLLAGGYPMTAMAEATDSAPPSVVSEQSEQTPATTTTPQATQLVPEKYSYNPDTEHWDSNKWAFNPATNHYEPVVRPLVSEEVPPVVEATPVSELDGSPHGQTNGDSTLTVNTGATINNTLNSDATTGNAGVRGNTVGGNATTGDASAIATVINEINSSVNSNGAEFATFVTDVVGDVHGDIMLYPMLLASMLQAANNPHPSDSSIAVNNDTAITNNVNLNATSGNAAVSENTKAGNATTGTANTVANVMNIINSIIAANQSFVGTVNIYGNLDGDILVAPDFLPQLLTSNNGGSSTAGSSLAVSSQETQSILNNINLNAASGNAVVADNTTAGNASTGNVATNLVLLNLSGHQIVANDSLLVFVNVLGQWVGLIVDAPNGATAAALGNGVTTNTATPDLSIDVDNKSQIVNNLNLNSQSGNATVDGNTRAGNATTGNATASANVANITGSQMGLSGWFGVLFINVFGSWLGSFGVDTERGNQPVSPSSGGSAGHTTTGPFQFVADSARSTKKSIPFFGGYSGGQDRAVPVSDATETEGEVKGVAATAASSNTGTPIIQSTTRAQQIDVLPFIAATFVLGLGVVATKNVIAFFRGRGAIA